MSPHDLHGPCAAKTWAFKERLHNCAQSQASMHENGVCATECVKSKVSYVQNMRLKWASEKQEDEKTSIA